MTLKLRHDSSGYLTCEHVSVFYLLMLNSGIMGAYTYVVRGGVFCNAQTANFLMLGISLGEGNFKHALFYFIPISAYVLGAIASEILPTPIKHYGLFRWDTWLVGFEALILFIIGFIPTTVPDPVVQVAVNFIASMQYNTFRQAEGIPMATTFCTNHIRQVGIGVAKLVRKHDQKGFHRGMEHLGMIVCFCVGPFLLSVFCKFMNEKSIWIALVPLLILFYRLAHADLTWEHDLLNKKPAGH